MFVNIAHHAVARKYDFYLIST